MPARREIKPGTVYGNLTALQEVTPVTYVEGGQSRRFSCKCNKCGSVSTYFLTNMVRGAKKNPSGEYKGVGCYKCRNKLIKDMVQSRKKISLKVQ